LKKLSKKAFLNTSVHDVRFVVLKRWSKNMTNEEMAAWLQLELCIGLVVAVCLYPVLKFIGKIRCYFGWHTFAEERFTLPNGIFEYKCTRCPVFTYKENDKE
jgi:hypothetical protein